MSRLMSRKAQKSLKPRFLRPRWTARSLSELCRSWLMRKRFETPSIEMAVVISCSELLGEVGLEPPERLDRGDEDAHGDHADDGEVAQVPEQIGRASCRERVWQYGLIWVVADTS